MATSLGFKTDGIDYNTELAVLGCTRRQRLIEREIHSGIPVRESPRGHFADVQKLTCLGIFFGRQRRSVDACRDLDGSQTIDTRSRNPKPQHQDSAFAGGGWRRFQNGAKPPAGPAPLTEIGKETPEELLLRARVGNVPQRGNLVQPHHLFPNLTTRQNSQERRRGYTPPSS